MPEATLTPDVYETIDSAIAEISGRNIVATSEMVDLLLDVRFAIAAGLEDLFSKLLDE